MKNTLIIAYAGGVYGTYLEWALNCLMLTDPIQDPFTAVGNSHKSKLGKNLCVFENFQKYLESKDEFATARLHPKTTKETNLKDNLEFLVNHTSHVILLYPDREHELMCLCNYMTKVYSQDLDSYDGAMSYINSEDIYQGYNIAPETDLSTLPVWIHREHMSFNFFNFWRDQLEWYFPDKWNNSQAMVITTKELFEDFASVLARIENFWGVKYLRAITDMLPWHSKMIGLQANLGKDQLCADIIQATIDSSTKNFDFGELCLTSQAWIQHQLRFRGYEIRCHDLDTFPHNTKQLQDLIYKV